ncbi:MAG: hypothetical protein K940chlam1_01000 [Candidatus Anoxychlamydiales bacterium]|nr:hypothetical protein [Candidatus Anoxychlamydiales bacterium]
MRAFFASSANKLAIFILTFLNTFRYVRTWSQPIRTISFIPVQIKITFDQPVPLYQKLSSKIKELNVLGMPCKEIAVTLKISLKTVKKDLHVRKKRKVSVF